MNPTPGSSLLVLIKRRARQDATVGVPHLVSNVDPYALKARHVEQLRHHPLKPDRIGHSQIIPAGRDAGFAPHLLFGDFFPTHVLRKEPVGIFEHEAANKPGNDDFGQRRVGALLVSNQLNVHRSVVNWWRRCGG